MHALTSLYFHPILAKARAHKFARTPVRPPASLNEESSVFPCVNKELHSIGLEGDCFVFVAHAIRSVGVVEVAEPKIKSKTSK